MHFLQTAKAKINITQRGSEAALNSEALTRVHALGDRRCVVDETRTNGADDEVAHVIERQCDVRRKRGRGFDGLLPPGLG